ncbi:DUF6758 family protein [Sphaerisporangium sp. TRM90804]|uniref:DUF6758 family protein n=1 Tax=Sphaerisporangium sp. TRM90804 TaxID=3031113 RepID=UPI00244BEDBA|nr:DUF6758 family protein [Sphaerisporangium sp. TRM90804]MDH2429846.1 hypothetical protein [Sphaerisporangium sp. TRM90804]
MRAAPICPRCFGPLRPPSEWSTEWRCGVHGAVLPFTSRGPSSETLDLLRADSRVPFWLPWPLPTGWLVTGFGDVRDSGAGVHAGVVALSGPSVTYGPADLLIVAEEPGVGLGAAFAGIDGPDPGPGFDAGPPNAKAEAVGHPTALWWVESLPDRAVYVGEAMGHWLWMIAWPAEAGCMVALTELSLRDLTDDEQEFDLPYGAVCPRLEVGP